MFVRLLLVLSVQVDCILVNCWIGPRWVRNSQEKENPGVFTLEYSVELDVCLLRDVVRACDTIVDSENRC